MTSSKCARWLLGLSLTVGIAAAASTAPDELPKAQLTRFLSPAGQESLSLSCYPDAANPKSYVCDIVREQNGSTVSRVTVKGTEIDRVLGRFFKRMPVKPVKLSPSETKDPVLGWEIHYREKKTQGQVPRFERSKTWSIKSALLALEADLTTQFYR